MYNSTKAGAVHNEITVTVINDNKIKLKIYTPNTMIDKKIKENTFYINYKNNGDTLKWYQVIIWKDGIVFIIYYVTLQSITRKSWKSLVLITIIYYSCLLYYVKGKFLGDWMLTEVATTKGKCRQKFVCLNNSNTQ